MDMLKRKKKKEIIKKERKKREKKREKKRLKKQICKVIRVIGDANSFRGGKDGNNISVQDRGLKSRMRMVSQINRGEREQEQKEKEKERKEERGERGGKGRMRQGRCREAADDIIGVRHWNRKRALASGLARAISTRDYANPGEFPDEYGRHGEERKSEDSFVEFLQCATATTASAFASASASASAFAFACNARARYLSPISTEQRRQLRRTLGKGIVRGSHSRQAIFYFNYFSEE